MTILFILLFALLLLMGLILKGQLHSVPTDPSEKGGQDSRDWKQAFELIASKRSEVAFHMDPVSGTFTYSSDPASGLLGYDSESLPTGFDLLRRLVHPGEQSLLKEMWERLRGGEDIDTSLRLIRPDGSYCWIQLIATQTSQREMLGILRNVHDLHKGRDALEETRRMQTVTTMAGGLAHEFNNHLTPVTGFIELALDYLGDEHPVSEGLETAMSRAQYCSELVSQIQSFGQRQVLKKEVIELDRFLPVAMNVAMTGNSNSASHVEIIREWTSPLPCVFGDQSRLREAMSQLIRNSLEAMTISGTLTVTVGYRTHHTATGVLEDPDSVFIKISDTGTGISPESREHIFDPFFSTHSDDGARGMGLPMVQGIVAQHEGWLEIQSEPNHGTDVTVFLPTHQSIPPTHEGDDDDTLSVLTAAPAGRMLVADDEEAICRLIQKTFEADDWDVVALPDYHEVLKKVVTEKEEFDLLILDITMPGPSANESLEQILKIHPDIPVLLISGFSRDDRIEGLIEQAKASFLGKPFSTRDLISSVDELMPASSLKDAS